MKCSNVRTWWRTTCSLATIILEAGKAKFAGWRKRAMGESLCGRWILTTSMARFVIKVRHLWNVAEAECLASAESQYWAQYSHDTDYSGPFPLMNMMKETFDEVRTTTPKPTPWWLMPTTTSIQTTTASQAASLQRLPLIHLCIMLSFARKLSHLAGRGAWHEASYFWNKWTFDFTHQNISCESNSTVTIHWVAIVSARRRDEIEG